MATLTELLTSKIPPHSLEAERAVLGAILLEKDSLPRVVEALRPSDFYKEGHRKVFEAMIALFERSEPVDLLTLREELRRRAELEEVGGDAALATMVEEATTAAHLHTYAAIVREKALLRELIGVSTQIIGQSYEARENVDLLLDRAEQLVFQISERRLQGTAIPVRSILKETFEYIERLYERKEHITGLPTGIRDLDRMTSGLQPSDFIIIAGRPSMGKTSFALNIARYAAIELHRTVLVLSLEMSKEQLVQRLLCAEAKVDSHRVRTGYLESRDWPKLTNAAGKLAEAPIFIDDQPALSALEARAKARRMKVEHDLDLVIVDYLQLMRGRNVENRQQEISDISRSLKALAKEIRVPVVALSQLSRAVEARAQRDYRPQLSDLRECVTGDTVVVLADGRRIPIRDLVGTAPEVLAMSPTGKIVAAKSESVWRVGRKPVFSIRLASGRVIRATERHRLFAAAGWRRVSALSVGDRLAIARRLPESDAAREEFGCEVKRYAGHGNWHQLPSRSMLSEYVEILDDEEPHAHATSDLFWDRMVAIEADGEETVFDLTVPGPASWLADGIVSHNSGALEQDADLILFLYRPGRYGIQTEEGENHAEVIVGKQRNGPEGTVPVVFMAEYASFENRADLHRQPF